MENRMKLWQIFFVHSVRSNIFASTWSDALHCSEVHANLFLGEKLTQKVSAKNVENTLIICEMQRLYEGLDLYLFAHICTDEPTKRSIRKQWLPFVSESCWLKFSNCVNICGKSSPVNRLKMVCTWTSTSTFHVKPQYFTAEQVMNNSELQNLKPKQTQSAHLSLDLVNNFYFHQNLAICIRIATAHNSANEFSNSMHHLC